MRNGTIQRVLGQRVLGQRVLGALSLCLGLAGLGSPALAEDAKSDHLELGLGYSDVLDSDKTEAVEFSAIYRPNVRYLQESLDFGDWWRGVGPMVGGRINGDDAAIGHAGLFLDIRLGERLVFWPSASVGAYHQGDGNDLGGGLQFMEEAYLGYRLPWDDLIGVAYQHVSNAGLHDDNPGHDTALVTYTISFGPLF